MREISLDDAEDLSKLPVDTFLLYGETGTGKTTCSGGFPRPLVLADETEGGWKSLVGLADDQLFEPDVNPIVWTISAMNDMATALEKVRPLIASGRVMTVVISSITFYANTYLAHLQRNKPGGDSRQIYGALGAHLLQIRTSFHSLGTNVVWEALADHPETAEDGRQGRAGRPSIPGKSAEQFSAGVTYLFRCALDDVRKDGKITDRVLKLYTLPTGGYLSRPRVGKALPQLPNPLLGGYRGFLAARGYDAEALRRALPPIQRISTPSTAPAAPKPAATPKTTTPAPKPANPPSGAKAPTK
jgi:hypothetical protein